MGHEDVVQRLDKLLAILQLAHHDAIEAGRAAIRADDLNAAILEAAAKRIAAGDLIRRARRARGAPSESTVKRRISALVGRGALERSGAGPSTAYQVTGLV
jgi:hypothetical protein